MVVFVLVVVTCVFVVDVVVVDVVVVLSLSSSFPCLSLLEVCLRWLLLSQSPMLLWSIVSWSGYCVFGRFHVRYR